MSFDGAPIIDRTPVEGLYIDGGWCYGGFKATPGSGLVFSHLLARGENHPVGAPFSLSRFEEGRTYDEQGAGPMPHHR
jgi:sarcosine oxidase subunit beta